MYTVVAITDGPLLREAGRRKGGLGSFKRKDENK